MFGIGHLGRESVGLLQDFKWQEYAEILTPRFN